MITNEDDVRKHVRDVANGRVRWIEPGMGGTFGMPDCWVPKEGRCVHIELKCGFIKDGNLRYTVRPEQKKQLQLLKMDKIPCGLLIGVESTDLIIAAKIDAETLSGKLKMEKDSGRWMVVTPHNLLDWNRTVAFFVNGSGSTQSA
jgi:hypothetical protein